MSSSRLGGDNTATSKFSQPKDIEWVTKAGKRIYITARQASQYYAQRQVYKLAHVIAKEAVKKYGGTVKDYMYKYGVNPETGEEVKGAVGLAEEDVKKGYVAAWDNVWREVSDYIVNAISSMNSERWKNIFSARWNRCKTKELTMQARGKTAGGKLLTYQEASSGKIHELIKEIVFTSDDGHSEKVYQNNWSPFVDLLIEIGFDDLAQEMNELSTLLTQYDRDENLMI